MIWNEPPEMEPGTPEPDVLDLGNTLYCAYRCKNPDFPGWNSGEDITHPGFDEYFSVLEFTDVKLFFFGAPCEETLLNDPLFKLGVGFYGFFILENSPEVLNDKDYSHWVITFHDETLQVIAKSGTVKHRRIDAGSAKEALERINL